MITQCLGTIAYEYYCVVQVYPNDPTAYGPLLAGQPLLPGCEPMVCKPTYTAELRHGSIHVQVRCRESLRFALAVIMTSSSHLTLCHCMYMLRPTNSLQSILHAC